MGQRRAKQFFAITNIYLMFACGLFSTSEYSDSLPNEVEDLLISEFEIAWESPCYVYACDEIKINRSQLLELDESDKNKQVISKWCIEISYRYKKGEWKHSTAVYLVKQYANQKYRFFYCEENIFEYCVGRRIGY